MQKRQWTYCQDMKCIKKIWKRGKSELYGNLKLIWRWKWQWGLKLQAGKRDSLFIGSQCSLYSCLQLYSRVAISHQEHPKRVISTVMEVIPFHTCVMNIFHDPELISSTSKVLKSYHTSVWVQWDSQTWRHFNHS